MAESMGGAPAQAAQTTPVVVDCDGTVEGTPQGESATISQLTDGTFQLCATLQGSMPVCLSCTATANGAGGGSIQVPGSGSGSGS
jgi:hypothetical protein